jgi:hypothetical protein
MARSHGAFWTVRRADSRARYRASAHGVQTTDELDNLSQLTDVHTRSVRRLAQTAAVAELAAWPSAKEKALDIAT